MWVSGVISFHKENNSHERLVFSFYENILRNSKGFYAYK